MFEDYFYPVFDCQKKTYVDIFDVLHFEIEEKSDGFIGTCRQYPDYKSFGSTSEDALKEIIELIKIDLEIQKYV